MFPLPLDQWLAQCAWAKRPLHPVTPTHDWLAHFCLCSACEAARFVAGQAQMPETD